MVFESQHLEGIGDDESLLLVVRRRHSLEDFELGKSSSASCGESGQHASDGSPEDSGGTSVVRKACAWVSVSSLSEELSELDFVSEERSGDVDLFSSDDDDSLAYISEGVPLRSSLATYEASLPRR